MFTGHRFIRGFTGSCGRKTARHRPTVKSQTINLQATRQTVKAEEIFLCFIIIYINNFFFFFLRKTIISKMLGLCFNKRRHLE